MSFTGYSLAQMTKVDAGDVPGWLVRAQRELGETGFGTLAVSRETGSILDLSATLVVGGDPRSACLTVYKRYGRVRIAAGGDAGSAPRLEALLADQLELVIATRIVKPVTTPVSPQTIAALSEPVKRALTRTI
jgi:hypothetical protein